jgi:hypothetical protein
LSRYIVYNGQIATIVPVRQDPARVKHAGPLENRDYSATVGIGKRLVVEQANN